MWHQEVGLLRRVSDLGVHNCPGWNISGFTEPVTWIFRKKSGIVTFLDDQERDSRFVSRLEGSAGSLDGTDLTSENFFELTLAHPVTVVDDAFRCPATES